MGEVRRLWIPGPAGRLEACLRLAARPRASVALAHPHPLHGGTLHNPVVFHVDRALSERGATTLRFNFRGVGSSEGVHDAGRGELEDLAAAASWLRGLAPEAPAVLAGYSFGAWCALRLAERDFAFRGAVLLGLPVGIWPLDEVERLARPLAVVQGSQDELGPLEQVRQLLERARPAGRLYVVEGAGHTFARSAREAGARAAQALDDLLAAISPPAAGPSGSGRRPRPCPPA